MVTTVFAETDTVVTLKVTDVAPAGTVTEAGTVAFALFEDKETTSPLGPAGPERVTVPVTVAPPRGAVGVRVRPEIVATLTVNVADCELLPRVPVINAEVVVETAVVDTVNVALVAEAAIVTDAGTVVLGSPEVSDTTSPPVGAGPLIVTVPVEEFPPWTAVGARVKLLRLGAEIFNVAVWVTPP